MYFEDMVPHHDKLHGASAPELKVGWLDPSHAFTTGDVPPELLGALFFFCRAAPERTEKRGFYTCELCEMSRDAVPTITYGGETVKVGYQEIRAFGEDGSVYAAPSLIFHYVSAHGYRPPDVFVQAVLRGPQPGTAEYEARIAQLWPPKPLSPHRRRRR